MKTCMITKKRVRIRGLIPRSVRRRVPKSIGFKAQSVYSAVQDLVVDFIYSILGCRGEFTPPRRLFKAAGIGGRVIEFAATGKETLRCIIAVADLKPYETILEVGCGIGRNAVPLTVYLNRNGSYEGLDIVPVSIAWCRSKITPKFPNFRFRLASVYNRGYNPNGRLKASEYEFPYGNEFFDFVFLTSVFTHMIPKDVEHYISEIARVLKTGGRCMVTFLLLNPESLSLMNSGLSDYTLKYKWGPCRLRDKDLPEATIAYEEDYVRGLFRRSGLKIIAPIRYGSWSGRRNFFSGQDIILARKTRQITN